MGKYVNNQTSDSNKRKAAQDHAKKKAFAPVKGSVGLKGSYSDAEKKRSRSQAQSDAQFQERMMRERQEAFRNQTD